MHSRRILESERSYFCLGFSLLKDTMYTVPQKCLDDYYWMLASVSNQTNSRRHEDLSVSAKDNDRRFPGLRPMLITNDQMRDHRWDLLEPREFRRYCSCHIVNYDICFDTGESGKRKIEFFPADVFSREIQGNKQINESGLVWHIPVTEWDDPDRLCLSIPL